MLSKLFVMVHGSLLFPLSTLEYVVRWMLPLCAAQGSRRSADSLRSFARAFPTARFGYWQTALGHYRPRWRTGGAKSSAARVSRSPLHNLPGRHRE